MEVEKNLDLIQLAIQRLIEEKRSEREISSKNSVADDDHDHQLLSKLLSELESLKENSRQPEPSLETTEPTSLEAEDKDRKDEMGGRDMTEMGTKAIVKELRQVKRQNSITHWLLSIMIVATAVWQFSEVSLILSARKKLSHPFKAVGSLISEAFRGGLNGLESAKPPASLNNLQVEAPSLLPLEFPKLPYVDLPSMVSISDEE